MLPVEAATGAASNPKFQKGFLLIQINDLDVKTSSLNKINFVFVNSADQTAMKIMQVFPSTDLTRDALLASQFKLHNSKKVDSKFIEILRTTFDYKWDGLFVYDSTALNDFSTWLVSQVVLAAKPGQNVSGITDDQVAPALCIFIKTHPKTELMNYSISKNTSHHFFSDLSRKGLAEFLKNLSPEPPFSSCEVLTSK